MKKSLIIFAFFSVSLNAVSQDKNPGAVKFIGSTDTMYNGSQVVLYNRVTDNHDSAIVKNGQFEITVNYKEPTRYMFYSKYELKTKGGYAPYGILVTGPGEIKMKVDMESFSKTTVTGSRENDLYNEYAAASNAVQQKIMDQLATKYGKDFLSRPDPKDPKYKELVADYQAMSAANMPAELERLETFVKSNPDSYAAIYVLAIAFNNLPLAKSEDLFDKLSAKYKSTANGQRIAAQISAARLTAIGKVAPDFEQTDTLGKMVKLSDLRGKYVLVDFWASWCGPCRAENPNVVKAFASYKEKGFTVLGISLDQPGKQQAWLDAIHKDGLTWTHVSDLKYWDNAVAKLYGIQSIPQNYLLDPQGKIIASNIRGEELNKKLSELFKM